MDASRDPVGVSPDPVERALRGLLLEQAQRAHPPVSLEVLVDAVIAGERPSQAPRAIHWSRMVAALAAALVVIVVSGLLVGRTAAPFWGIGADDVGPAIVWDSGSVRLEADAIRIEGIGTFSGTPDVVRGAPAISLHSATGDASHRTLEVEWQERGLPMRLFLYVEADDTDWWVTEIRTYDGSSGGEWIHYVGPLFRTPLGGTFSGDFAATGEGGNVPGSLRMEGLRLTAFAPGTGPAPRTGCAPWRIVPGADALTTDDIVDLPPGQAAARLRERGVCYEFRWDYRTGPGSGFAERWCVPPPTGRVSDVSFLSDGAALLYVEDDSGFVRDVREQPPAGWGCASDQRGAAPPEPGGSAGAATPAASESPVPAGPSSTTVEAEVPPTPVP
jgi:hypothetical protein